MKKRKIKSMLMRRAFCNVMALAMVFSSLVVPQGAVTAYAEGEQDGDGLSFGTGDVTTPAAITVTASDISSYKATQIKNGDFEETPWQDFVINGVKYTGVGTSVSGKIDFSIPNGVGEGWNTTEIQPYKGNLFEVWPTGSPLDPNETQKGSKEVNGKNYIEMNTTNPACLYQDLETQGGDVIKWTLQHAARNKNGCDQQSMYVTIGAPKRGKNGEILAASGVNTATTTIDPKIEDAGKAEYRSSGVTAASGNAICVSGSSMSGLSVGKNDKTWHEVAGIYVVPEGQDVTRFAFCAESVGDSSLLSYGNFLDNITFSTLFGNLKATKQENGDVQVSGYWGESDSSKKLVVELAEKAYKENIDMSEVCNSSFTINIPKSIIGDSQNVKVYHQDYETATEPVPVMHEHRWSYVSGTGNDANKIYAYCTATSGSACSYQGGDKKIPMTLTAANATYNGSDYSGARVSPWPVADDTLAAKPEIIYYLSDGATLTDPQNNGAEDTGKAPKNAGDYTAKIQIEGATATVDFTIGKLGISAVSFNEPATKSDSAPSTTLTTAGNAFYEGGEGGISWSPGGAFVYNEQYTATVTLTAKDNCMFVTPSSITAPDGWKIDKNASDAAEKLVLTKTYTIKPKINSVTAPTDMQLSEFTTKEDQIEALLNYVPVEVEDHSVTGMAINWALKGSNYSTTPSAENTFTWTIQESEYKNKYDTNSKPLKGEIKIKNPSHPPHRWIFEGQEKQLSAYCALAETAGCTYDSANKLTLTLNASNAIFSGNAYTGASISAEGQSAWTAAGLEIPAIKYEGDTGTDYSLSDTAPIAVGNYKAVISVGEEKAEAAFQITSGGSGGGSGSGGSGSSGSGGSGSGSSGSGGSGSSGSGSSSSGSSSGGGSGSGGSSSGAAGGTQPTTPTENFDIPVKNENTVKVEAEIKDGTANVSEITNKTIEKVVNNKDAESKVDTITIDLSGAKQEVTGVTLSKESVKTLAETTAQKDNGIDTATIELSKVTVELDHKALETLAEQAKGTQIQLVVEDKDRKELNSAQQTTLSQHQVATTFEAYFTSDGQRIHDFKGGKAVVSIDFTPEAGKDTSYYHMVYVAESGDMTRYKTKYENRRLMFTTTHFSDYAVIYDTGEKNETEKPSKEEEEKEDSSETGDKITMDTSYSKLRLRIPTSTKKTNVLKWTKQTGADGYVIYGNHCNTGTKKYKMVQRVVIKDGSTTTWIDKNLDGGTYYKYYIKAYKLVNGKKVWLAKSKVVHSTTTGGKYGNAKTVKVNKTDLSLTKGQTFTIKAEQVIKDKPIDEHQDIKYESSNTKVASVNSKGVIKAKKKGTCYIYVYAQNGMYKRIKVTVK